ncbi:MAG: GTPase family protein [Thermosynechococcaceae cyanobacterium]
MIRLRIWQWFALILPIATVLGFLAVAAGVQIHDWHLSWIWAVVVLILLGWRWLLARWLRIPQLDSINISGNLETAEPSNIEQATLAAQAESEVQRILVAAREDVLPWENWPHFFERCQSLVTAVAQVYYPQVKRPLLNIYVPQAYGLLRGTVDDVDAWMQKLAPTLGQVTIGQAYETYETYRRLEPAARTALKMLNWSRWLFNPAAAVARTATQSYRSQANQQLLGNLGQLMRETTLKALGERAIALYSGQVPQPIVVEAVAPEKTQTLRQLFEQADSVEALEQAPLNILLVGRTGAGKSSLINTLFKQELAEVDVLPSTDRFETYKFSTPDGETLTLWDAPGYEQVGRDDLRLQVLQQAASADVLLLLTPALDPALQMDREFLDQVQAEDLPLIIVVTQVDRLRPIREWQPPYDWQQGQRPKEKAIREAIAYRQEILADLSPTLLPLVTSASDRLAWGVTPLSDAIVNALPSAQQGRLARFLRDQNAQVQAAAKIIERYAFQMSTTQGLAALLKSPVLGFISTMMSGSPALATVLATNLPIEQSPVVMGKLQMAWELYSLLGTAEQNFDLLFLWPLLLETAQSPAQEAWAFGQTLVEYWLDPSEEMLLSTLRTRYQDYLENAKSKT